MDELKEFTDAWKKQTSMHIVEEENQPDTKPIVVDSILNNINNLDQLLKEAPVVDAGIFSIEEEN